MFMRFELIKLKLTSTYLYFNLNVKEKLIINNEFSLNFLKLTANL